MKKETLLFYVQLRVMYFLSFFFFLAALGLCCRGGFAPSAVSRGSPPAAVRGLSAAVLGSRARPRWLWHTRIAAESSQTRGQIHVPCTGGRILNYWTTTEAPVSVSYLECLKTYFQTFLGFPGGSEGKESTCNAQDPGSIPGQEGPLNEGMATPSSILAWRIPWMAEPGGLQSMGVAKSRTRPSEQANCSSGSRPVL